MLDILYYLSIVLENYSDEEVLTIGKLKELVAKTQALQEDSESIEDYTGGY